MIVFGVLVAALYVVSAGETAAVLRSTSEPSLRQRLQLHLAASILRGVGLLGLYMSQALAFRDWKTFFLPFTPPAGLPRGRQARRRLFRQIEGQESYESDEVALLRRLAEWRVGLGTHTVSGLSLIVFACGIALSPIGFTPGNPPALVTPFERGFQILGVVLAVATTASMVARRKATDRQAREFLEATQPAAKPNP